MNAIRQLNLKHADYLIKHYGQPSELDTSCNDTSRKLIKAVYDQFGQAWLGNVNLYSLHDKTIDEQAQLIPYNGQFVYNFEYDFVLPAYNSDLMLAIVDRHKKPYTTAKADGIELDRINEMIDGLGGQWLIWS